MCYYIIMKKFLILLLTALGLIGFFSSPIMNIQYVHVYGNENLSTSIIINTIPETSHVFSYSSRRAVEALKNNLPQVYRASVSRNFFNRELTIEIVERRTIAYVRFSNEQYLHIDINGKVLATSTYTSPNLPIVLGLYFREFSIRENLDIPKENLYILATFATFLTAYNVQGISVDVSDLSNIRMYYSGLKIKLGQAAYLDEKIRIFAGILPHIPSGLRGIGGTLYIYDPRGQWRLNVLN